MYIIKKNIAKQPTWEFKVTWTIYGLEHQAFWPLGLRK